MGEFSPGNGRASQQFRENRYRGKLPACDSSFDRAMVSSRMSEGQAVVFGDLTDLLGGELGGVRDDPERDAAFEQLQCDFFHGIVFAASFTASFAASFAVFFCDF